MSLAWSLAGCSGALAEAPFAATAGSVVRGDLRGPFEGQVVDAASGKPVSGAAVLAAWSFERGVGPRAPAAAEHRVVETDADGRYFFPELDRSHGARLDRFTLIVYKAGHAAYRSDRRWPDLGRRMDFAQRGNLVRLEAFPTDGSHVKHLRFVGAGGPLQPLLAGEMQLAAEEHVGRAAAGRAPAALDARRLLTDEDIRQLTGFKGEFSLGKLADIDSGPTYDSVHFRAKDQTEKFDAALRVHLLPPAEAEERFEGYRADLPSVEEKDEIGDRSLRAEEGDIRAMAALDRRRGIVVVMTCGTGLCPDSAVASSVFRRAWARIGRLGGASPDRTLAAPPPPSKPADDKMQLKPLDPELEP